MNIESLTINLDIIAKFSAPIITAIIAFVLKRFFESKPKLITYLVQASTVTMTTADGQPVPINTHSMVVRNAGKISAKNVRIGHNIFPPGVRLYPELIHEVIKGDNGTAEILIPTLVPGEQVNITYMYFPGTTWHQINSYCKSDESSARYVNVTPNQQAPKSLRIFVGILLFIGASTTTYWIVQLLWLWIFNK